MRLLSKYNPINYLCFKLIILLSSCSINGSFKGLYSYYEKTQKEKPNLIISNQNSNTLCNIKNDSIARIYTINGYNLKNCIANQVKTICYIWAPRCKGKFCYSLNAVQNKCKSLSSDLFIVSEYYDSEMMSIKYNLDKPIFGIDTKYYKSDLTSNYMSNFIKDLTAKDKVNGRFLLFKNGLYITSCLSLDSIPSYF